MMAIANEDYERYITLEKRVAELEELLDKRSREIYDQDAIILRLRSILKDKSNDSG